MRKQRKSFGFTLIELLVAMGILVILIGLVAFTVNGMIGGAKTKDTKVRLQTMANMLTELKVAGGLKRQPAKMYFGPTPTAYTNPNNPPFEPFDIWTDGDPSDNATQDGNGNFPPHKPIVAPTQVTEDAFKAGKNDRINSAAVLNTQLAMGMLASMPVNKTALEKTSASSLLANPLADTSIPTTRIGNILRVNNAANGERSALKPALLVDGWNNPIIMVPAGGLAGVNVGYTSGDRNLAASYARAGVIVTSTGEIFANDANYRPPAGAQPFFASAGPDGDFTTGDDNVYSFTP